MPSGGRRGSDDRCIRRTMRRTPGHVHVRPFSHLHREFERPSTTLQSVVPQTLSSAPRRVLVIGVVIVAALSVGLALQRRGGNEATVSTGNVGSCLQLKGDAARACYSREVGKQLAAA